MTWQRIEENTYIDDSLVTCAEYQLFVDEMREQGKYYQPDHWTSYQFAQEQAHKPILGVRFSDANAFCVWLTIRIAGEWNFRLPDTYEALQYPLNDPTNPLGYWINELKSGVHVEWVGPIPVNPRHLEFNNNFFSSILIRETFTRIRDRALDLEYSYSADTFHDPSLDHALDQALDRARDTLHDRISDLDFANKRALELIQHQRRGFSGALDRPRALALEQDAAFALALLDKLFLDIYTLRERIEGRSPAFEGIRLVKERK